MKKVYRIGCLILLLVLLAGGLVSLFDKDPSYSKMEERTLQSFPKITFSSLIDGTFFDSLAEYYTDTFPGREALTEKSMGWYGFITETPSSEEDPKPQDPEEGTVPSQAATEPSEEFIPELTEPKVPVQQLGNVLLVGDRAMEVPYGNEDKIRRYAAAVNGLAELLGDRVETYNMLIPNAAEFYAGSQWNSGVYSQRNMLATCRAELDKKVTYVDAYTQLAKHLDEYIYFRTDHHWTHLGAYYAYTALCAEAGLEAEEQSKFATGQWENFVGSMFTYTAGYTQSSVLKNNPDTVHYWKPHANCETHYYEDTGLKNGMLMGTICVVREEEDNKYLTFMGGDYPVSVVTTDSEGPCILVIKDSYGNALISWLTSHYSKIIVIDPREYFDGRNDIDLKTFAQEQGVDQMLIVNYPMMLNSDNYIRLLERLTE